MTNLIITRGFVAIRVVKLGNFYPEKRILGDKSNNKKESRSIPGEFSYVKSHSE